MIIIYEPGKFLVAIEINNWSFKENTEVNSNE